MLQGRAYLEARIKLKEKRYNNVGGGTMKIVVDGYNAPVTAGAFVDLVEKKFYDGMEIQRADGLVVQTGRPEGEVRLTIPMNHMNENLDDDDNDDINNSNSSNDDHDD